MTRTAAGLIIDAHVAMLPTLTGWGGNGSTPAVAVVEGPLARQDAPPRWATIGYVAGDDSPHVSFVPVPEVQHDTRESGSIACALYVADADVPTARASLLTLVESWAGWLVGDRTLGGRLLGDSETHLEVDLTIGLNRSSGGLATARVVITYTAHTYG